MAETRHVLIRCDAGPVIGGGHAMRCLTLADALREAGWTVTFAVSEATMPTVPALARAGHRVVPLGTPLDPAALTAALADKRFALALIDHYDLPAVYASALRAQAELIAVLDDAPNRPHDADFLLDPTYGRMPGAYAGLVPRHATRLTGSAYALLRHDFAAQRPLALARRDGRLRRVLVSLGLSDLDGITARVVEAILPVVLRHRLALDVVLGASAPSLPVLSTLAAATPALSLHVDTDAMAALMAQADLAIGAGGTTSWERCCLGLPTLLLVLAGNQQEIAHTMSSAGAAERFIPETLDAVAARLDALAADGEALEAMSRRAAALCDGSGTVRVVAALSALRPYHLTLADTPLTVRAADLEDRAEIWLWRNDAEARRHSLDTAAIPWPAHVAWWARALDDPARRLLMVERDGRSVGHVRFDQLADATRVSLVMAPAARGRGLAAAALAAALATLPARRRLCAEIHRDNPASQRVFARNGFRPCSATQDDTARIEGGFRRYTAWSGDTGR